MDGARLRNTITARLDPVVARRAATLSRRRSAGTTLPAATRSAVDTTHRQVLSDLTRAARAGRLDAATRAQVGELAAAWLAGVDSKAPAADTAAVCDAFQRLFTPGGQPAPEPPPRVTRAIVDSFHRLYYSVSPRTWKDTWYRGIRAYKCPTDMWVYQELLDVVRPALVIETGTFRGGSALFLADRLETAGYGEVVTVDIDVQPDRPEHPRLTYLTGSSVAPEILADITARIPDGGPVLVILDSDHSRDHVAAELRAYAPLVTVGSYLVVEDTNVNGHPAAPDHGPGPWEATQDFLAGDPGFEVDPRCERYYLTQNPRGYLRRVR